MQQADWFKGFHPLTENFRLNFRWVYFLTRKKKQGIVHQVVWEQLYWLQYAFFPDQGMEILLLFFDQIL